MLRRNSLLLVAIALLASSAIVQAAEVQVRFRNDSGHVEAWVFDISNRSYIAKVKRNETSPLVAVQAGGQYHVSFIGEGLDRWITFYSQAKIGVYPAQDGATVSLTPPDNLMSVQFRNNSQTTVLVEAIKPAFTRYESDQYIVFVVDSRFKRSLAANETSAPQSWPAGTKFQLAAWQAAAEGSGRLIKTEPVELKTNGQVIAYPVVAAPVSNKLTVRVRNVDGQQAKLYYKGPSVGPTQPATPKGTLFNGQTTGEMQLEAGGTLMYQFGNRGQFKQRALTAADNGQTIAISSR